MVQEQLADTVGAAAHTVGTADTLRAVAGAHEGASGNLFGDLLKHLHDSRELELPFTHIELPHFAPINVFGLSIDLSITKHVVFLWVAAAFLLIIAVVAARKNAKSNVPKGLGNVVEAFIVFIRDEIVVPNMGQRGLRYMPYLLTTFFFILTMNLFGLIPYGSSSTGNVNVTAGLAVIAFVVIQAAAIRSQGLTHYLAHFTGGVHWTLWPIMVPLEIIGHVTKAFALCMRLFANMMGGHTVIVSILGLIFLFGLLWVAPISALFVVGINLLEIFVAFLQAYVFTILTSVFMGLGMPVESRDEEHGKANH